MNQIIELQNEQVSYTLRRSTRARHLRLTVYPGGKVVVTVPFLMRASRAESYVREKAQWLLKTVTFYKTQPPRTSVARRGKQEYLKHKTAAYDVALKKVEHFRNIYGFAYNKITIRNQRTRWGSCSRKGNLSFTYKILFLSEALLDYIVVHELCHLKEMNHSRRFWALVAKTVPEYKSLRKQLRGSRLL